MERLRVCCSVARVAGSTACWFGGHARLRATRSYTTSVVMISAAEEGSTRGDEWQQLVLSASDGDVFDLSFVFDRNWRRQVWFGAGPSRPCSRRDWCAGILPHTFELDNVLSQGECDGIIALAEEVGFQRPERGGGIGSSSEGQGELPPDRMVWVTDLEWCDTVYRRMAGQLPYIGRYRPIGINPRWRLYRYEPGFGLARHQDRSFKASATDLAGQLRYDVLGDGSESLLTLLLYLNEGMGGGGTRLYSIGAARTFTTVGEVTPRPGSALLFPHGASNPCSVWHAGVPVESGVKYIVRTDVVYTRVAE